MKKSNYFIFLREMRRIYGAHKKVAKGFFRNQYTLLCKGVRGVDVSDAAIAAWHAAGGKW